MAYYAAVVSLVQLLKEINHPDHPFLNSILAKQQIHVSLYEKFNHLQELLEDYSPKDLNEEPAEILERRITDAAYRAQDMIESHISTTLLTNIHLEKRADGVTRLCRHMVSTFRKAHCKLQPQRSEGLTLDNIVERKYYPDLEKVRAEVDSIVEELKRVKVEINTSHEHLQINSYVPADGAGGTSKVEAPSGRNTMVGFEEQLTKIKSQLCEQSSRREVISIVGMGGLGKTTLARNIFDDRLVKERFDCCAWVTLSQDYPRQNILLAIVESLDIQREELREVKDGVLMQRIHQHLFQRRYLIVVDDIWETKVWDDVNRILPDDNNESRVVITTRMVNMAVYVSNSRFIHRLQYLDEDQSWILFCHKVLCPPKLENIGRLIAKNCGGLPLAIVVVAGILSKVNKAHDWEEIAKDVSTAAINQKDENLSRLLALSYNHLPNHLKPCFLYLGGFPKDYDVPVSILIKLWVAEGFLKPIASKSLEEVAEVYFKDLVNRNLVLITKKASNGKFKNCSMHDLLRDLCSQRAHSEYFFHCLHEKSVFHRATVGNVRRFYIQRWNDSLFGKYIKEHVSHVRAILFFDKDSVWHPFLPVASDFKLLRVLDTRRIRGVNLPNVMVELLHLRYLAVRASNIRIPRSIFKLQNLQTLIIDGENISLPSEIWKMPKLRHLMFRKGVTLPPIPYGERIIDGVPPLGVLQTLSTVLNFRFTHDTTEMIPSLKKLKVKCTNEPYDTWQMFGLNNLVHLSQLETLDIWFAEFTVVATPLPENFAFSSGFTSVAAPLPENFAFPSNLINLSLEGCELPWKDMGTVGLLSNLQKLELKFRSFVGEEWQPIEGEFLKLKFLLMEKLNNLKYWRAENTHFPCLEQLCIRYCRRLEKIPLEIGNIPTLQIIEVHGKNSDLNSSALEIQEEQRDLGNNDLQVRVVCRDEDIWSMMQI